MNKFQYLQQILKFDNIIWESVEILQKNNSTYNKTFAKLNQFVDIFVKFSLICMPVFRCLGQMSTRVTAFYYIFCDHPTILFQTTTNKHVQAYPKLVRCTPQDSQGPVLVHFGEKISVCAVVHNIKWHTNEVRTWRAPEGCTIKAIFCIFLVCWGCVQLYIYNLIIKRNP